MTDRYYHSSNYLPADEKLAMIKFAVGLALRKQVPNVHIFLYQKNLAEDHLHQVLPPTEVRKLERNEEVFIDGVRLLLVGQQTFNKYNRYDVMFALHVGDGTLAKLEEKGNVGSLIVGVLDQDLPEIAQWMEHKPTRMNYVPRPHD